MSAAVRTLASNKNPGALAGAFFVREPRGHAAATKGGALKEYGPNRSNSVQQ